jgi:cytochrome c-type biogenesis protein CcmE
MSRNTKILIRVVVIIAGIALCRFLVGALMLGSSIFYVQSSSDYLPEYFMTVNELLINEDNAIDKSLRISGAVIGESIEFDEGSRQLSFIIADIPADYETVEQQGGLTIVLEDAVNDPNRARIQIVYVGEKPELLRNMAQVIITGKLHSNGIFYADEILLKCPSRYEEAVPEQAID